MKYPDIKINHCWKNTKNSKLTGSMGSTQNKFEGYSWKKRQTDAYSHLCWKFKLDLVQKIVQGF